MLPSYHEVLSAKAQRHLEQLGVKVYTSTRVTNVDAEDHRQWPACPGRHRALESRRSRFSCGAMDKVATDKSGRIIVDSDLSVPDHPQIFAIGDTAHVVAHSRNLLGIKSNEPMLMPGVAQPAIQEVGPWLA